MLVGHSYGGSVITDAAAGNPECQSPRLCRRRRTRRRRDQRLAEGADSVLKQQPEAELFDKLPVPGRTAGSFDLYLKKDIFLQHFGNDLPADTARRLWATQRAASTECLRNAVKAAAWKTIPSWYFISSGDQIITPDFGEEPWPSEPIRTVTVFDGGSHLTLISHPDAVTAVIQSAIDSVTDDDNRARSGTRAGSAKTQRLTAGRRPQRRQGGRPATAERPAARGDPARRPRRAGRRQPEAGRLPVPARWPTAIPQAPQRPAHADLVGVTSRASRPVRTRHRRQTRPRLRRPAERADRADGRRRHGRHRRHPHLRRAVRADVRRPGARRRAAVRDRRPTATATSTPDPTPRTPRRSPRPPPSTTGWSSCRPTRSSTPKTLPRVDIPGDWVDFVVAGRPAVRLEPLFTRDPRHIGDVEILKAMIAIRGVYERHEVMSLNHGVGFDTAAIELLLPTYGEQLGLQGRIARHWVLNPHPTLIPAIESGWVESIHSFGGEAGMERYTAARPDVFFTGPTARCGPTGCCAQLAGQYAIDMFIGSSLQIDARRQLLDRHRRPAVRVRWRAEHGPRPARTQPRRRPAWLDLAHGEGASRRGRKLVVQMAQTFTRRRRAHLRGDPRRHRGRQAGGHAAAAGDDLRRRRLPRGHRGRRRLPVQGALAGRPARGAGRDRRGHAGRTRAPTPRRTEELRRDGLVAFPEDLGVETRLATRSCLAARSIEDLVAWSGGLYDPPAQFRDW